MELNAARTIRGTMPLPTTAPRPSLVRQRLEIRAGGSETCGYVGGSSDDPVVCTDGWQCARDPSDSAYGCCPEPVEDCILPIGCLDATAPCDSDCSSNPYLFQCPQSYPYCGIYLWDLGSTYTQLFCDKRPYILDTAELTYSGELGAAASSGLVFTATETSARSGKPSSVPLVPTISGSGSAAASIGANPAATTGSSSPESTSSAPTAAAAESSSGLSTGAVAGIAVGAALGGIGLLVGALLLFLIIPRRRRKRNNLAAAQGGHAPQTTGPYGPGGGDMPPPGGSAYMATQGKYAGSGTSRGAPTMLGTEDPSKNGFGQRETVFEYDVAGNPVTSPPSTYAVPSSPRSGTEWEKDSMPGSPHPAGPKY